MKISKKPKPPIKPLTPDQARLNKLRQNADKAKQAVRDERERQKAKKSL